MSPYSYQYGETGKRVVPARFAVKGSRVRFDVNAYDRNSILVIDPTFIFCSFAKSSAVNWGYTATYGPDGSMYGGGIVFGSGFPANTGAYDEDFNNGTYDIGIIRLSPDGTSRIYATYLGGSSDEQPHSLIVDAQGNCVVAGRTDSPNYPVTGAMLGTPGGYEIIITKISADGSTLIGSRKIGGSADDGVNISAGHSGRNSLQYNYGDDGRSEVILDEAGNIYLASATRSGDFPLAGAFQGTIGGAQDGVILKLTPTVSNILFSSYFGGQGNDAAYVLSIHPLNGNIYFAGGTESSSVPGLDGTSYQNTNQAGIDGFVAMISPAFNMIRSSFMGTTGTDQVYGIKFDRAGFPYIMGQSTGVWPVQNATWSQANGKQFISKLKQDLSGFVYSTKFGTPGAEPNIAPVAFLVDRCENVYVTGWGGSMSGYASAGTSGLPVINQIDPTRGTDGYDFYFFVLKKDAVSQLYGDFFGEMMGSVDHVDGGTSRFD
jgi:hypothetical protein